MRRYFVIGLACVLLITFLVFISLSKETPPTFIEMEVKGVRLDALGKNPVVILADKDGKKALPIWIGLPEANAIERELKNITPARPMTHDLLTLNKKLIEVDARPSDAIIIALKSKTPIFVLATILDVQGITLAKKNMGERYGIRIQELTPSLASHFNFKGQKGVLVSEVISGSASEVSGMKAGDIITKIDLKEIGSVQEFEEALEAVKVGHQVRMTLFRDDQFQEVNLSVKP